MKKRDSTFDWSKGGRARKILGLLRCYGLKTTVAIIASVIEDLYLRIFDRRYGVRTSGYIPLVNTSLGIDQAKQGHRYRPVNAWAFKHVIRTLAPDKKLRFVDLGCGLGRACLIAADYGFRRVRGVEFVPEFSAKAKENADAFCRASGKIRTAIEILLEDAVAYSQSSDDDIVFLYNPFPAEVLRQVVGNLLKDVRSKKRPTLIIYSQRVIETSKTLEILSQHELLAPIFEHSSWGQSFYVFKTNSN